jgi:hypothetical protein
MSEPTLKARNPLSKSRAGLNDWEKGKVNAAAYRNRIECLEAQSDKLRSERNELRRALDSIQAQATPLSVKEERGLTDGHVSIGRVLSRDEIRLEAGQVPDDVAAGVELASPATSSEFPDPVAFVSADQAVDLALSLLDQAAAARTDCWGAVDDDDHDRRWRLHVHASSLHDSTFWIERNQQRYRATEVETGVSGEWTGSTEAAMQSYFNSGR